MSKLFKIIHNVTTGEIEQVDLTDEEIAVIKADEAAALAQAESEAQRVLDKETLLAKLGITADEAKLLLK
jgi:hypothetical protein